MGEPTPLGATGITSEIDVGRIAADDDSSTFYLPLDDDSTSCADLSGNGYNGTVQDTGEAVLGSNLGCQRGGAGIEFSSTAGYGDGTGSTGGYVSIAAPSSLPRTDAWTAEGWAYISGVPYQAVILTWGVGTDQNSLVLASPARHPILENVGNLCPLDGTLRQDGALVGGPPFWLDRGACASPTGRAGSRRQACGR